MMIGFPDVESALSLMNTTSDDNYAILHIGKVEQQDVEIFHDPLSKYTKQEIPVLFNWTKNLKIRVYVFGQHFYDLPPNYMSNVDKIYIAPKASRLCESRVLSLDLDTEKFKFESYKLKDDDLDFFQDWYSDS